MDHKVAHAPRESAPGDLSAGAHSSYFEHLAATLAEYFEVHTVLDIGCSTGCFVLAFQDLDIKAYGVDKSRAASLNVPKQLEDQMYCLDVTRDELPFDDEKFDLITMSEVLEHLTDFQVALSEIKRVLKISGHIFLTTPSMPGADTFVNVLGLHRLRNPDHINVHAKHFWIKLFESYGLKYLGDFPRSQHMRALAAMSRSRFRRLMVKVYSIPVVPSLHSRLIFQKRM